MRLKTPAKGLSPPGTCGSGARRSGSRAGECLATQGVAGPPPARRPERLAIRIRRRIPAAARTDDAFVRFRAMLRPRCGLGSPHSALTCSSATTPASRYATRSLRRWTKRKCASPPTRGVLRRHGWGCTGARLTCFVTPQSRREHVQRTGQPQCTIRFNMGSGFAARDPPDTGGAPRLGPRPAGGVALLQAMSAVWSLESVSLPPLPRVAPSPSSPPLPGTDRGIDRFSRRLAHRFLGPRRLPRRGGPQRFGLSMSTGLKVAAAGRLPIGSFTPSVPIGARGVADARRMPESHGTFCLQRAWLGRTPAERQRGGRLGGAALFIAPEWCTLRSGIAHGASLQYLNCSRMREPYGDIFRGVRLQLAAVDRVWRWVGCERCRRARRAASADHGSLQGGAARGQEGGTGACRISATASELASSIRGAASAPLAAVIPRDANSNARAWPAVFLAYRGRERFWQRGAEAGSYSEVRGRIGIRFALGPVSIRWHDGATYARARASHASPLLTGRRHTSAGPRCERVAKVERDANSIQQRILAHPPISPVALEVVDVAFCGGGSVGIAPNTAECAFWVPLRAPPRTAGLGSGGSFASSALTAPWRPKRRRPWHARRRSWHRTASHFLVLFICVFPPFGLNPCVCTMAPLVRYP